MNPRWSKESIKNPCKRVESFAWISPKGQFYYLRGDKTHMQWAAEWVLAHVPSKDIPWYKVVQAYRGQRDTSLLQNQIRDGEFDPNEDMWETVDFLRYWAYDYLLLNDWVRVVNATTFQAKNLEQLPQAGEVLNVILQGVQDGCVEPNTNIWYANGTSDDALDEGMPAAEFVKWLGGKKAEGRLYEVALNRKMASRVASRYLACTAP